MSDRDDRDDRPDSGEDGVSYWRRVSQEEEKNEDDGKVEEYWNTPDDHGFRPASHPDYGPVPEPYRVNGMTKAAMACGVLSLLTILFGYGMLFACLGILFALLSRGKQMSRQAKAGLTMCIISFCIFAFSLLTVVGILTAGGAWPALMQKARVTDFSDPASMQEFESAVYDAFYRSLMPGSVSSEDPAGAYPAAESAESPAEESSRADSGAAVPGGTSDTDSGAAAAEPSPVPSGADDTGRTESADPGESSGNPFSLPPGSDAITV